MQEWGDGLEQSLKESVIGCDHACDTDISKGGWAQRTADVQQSEHERVGRDVAVSRRCGSVDDGPIDRGHDGVYPSIDISCKTMERSKPSFSQA